MKKAILAALRERDEEADICTDADGNPEPDTELRDHELVPLKEDWRDYVAREVTPFVPDAWVDESYRDARDGESVASAMRSTSTGISTAMSRRVRLRRSTPSSRRLRPRSPGC